LQACDDKQMNCTFIMAAFLK